MEEPLKWVGNLIRDDENVRLNLREWPMDLENIDRAIQWMKILVK